MMGRQDRDQRQLLYEFSLDEIIPKDHLLREVSNASAFVHLISIKPTNLRVLTMAGW